MAVLLEEPKPLTYDEYLAEGVVEGRYEIIKGVRFFMTSPSTIHQIIFLNIGRLFGDFQRQMRSARVLLAPVDVIVSREPFVSVRQPDVALISKARHGKRPVYSAAPLEQAPELVVEIMSPSESRRSIMAKMADYGNAGVVECWIVSPQAESVEAAELNAEGFVSSTVYLPGSRIISAAFPELIVAINEVFWLDEELGDLDLSGSYLKDKLI